ncbi:hypothetical protein Cob_v003283 [Colletotrichum orbiculare MAFF 240422]|uniref:Uncharacterized protein n=1 Tax=Colletotrichum orbiculare (strain 104-T / ATCC 96160 / CBS 514.97 / LARS 414 / MAFF 240422) TaxID=1213857 RepID=A0A484G2W2_COLOR|nr:hypothetical protein Cob_v003283 [Colletotrichum orbiculare MAFF 240422]
MSQTAALSSAPFCFFFPTSRPNSSDIKIRFVAGHGSGSPSANLLTLTTIEKKKAETVPTRPDVNPLVHPTRIIRPPTTPRGFESNYSAIQMF